MMEDIQALDRSIKISSSRYEKLENMRSRLRINKKQMLNLSVDITQRLFNQLNGHLHLLLDEAAIMKLYFDKDGRLEVEI